MGRAISLVVRRMRALRICRPTLRLPMLPTRGLCYTAGEHFPSRGRVVRNHRDGMQVDQTWRAISLVPQLNHQARSPSLPSRNQRDGMSVDQTGLIISLIPLGPTFYCGAAVFLSATKEMACRLIRQGGPSLQSRSDPPPSGADLVPLGREDRREVPGGLPSRCGGPAQSKRWHAG